MNEVTYPESSCRTQTSPDPATKPETCRPGCCSSALSPATAPTRPPAKHLDELQARARAVNTALLDTERVGQGCVLASPAFERIARPILTEDGRRVPALRFGDPRVHALAGALCTNVLAVTGIT